MSKRDKKLSISEAACALTFLYNQGSDFERIEDIEGDFTREEIKRKILPKKAFRVPTNEPRKKTFDLEEDYSTFRRVTDVDGNKILVIKGAKGLSYRRALAFKNKKVKKGVRKIIRICLTEEDLHDNVNPLIDATDVVIEDIQISNRLLKITDKITYEDRETHAVNVLKDQDI